MGRRLRVGSGGEAPVTAHRAVTASRRRAVAAVCAGVAAVGLVLAWLVPAQAAPVGWDDAGTSTCTTNSAGYCTVNHGLSRPPEGAVITLVEPYRGFTSWDQATSSSFRVHIQRPYQDRAYAGPLTFSWRVWAAPDPGPTTPAPTTTVPATTTPAATTTPPATTTPAPTTTAPAVGTWPSGWDDPRFAGNVDSGPRFNTGSTMVTWSNLTVNDQSGQPSFGYGNYTLLNSRMRTREGPRISGSNILIEDTYIEVAGVGSDHGDGIQAYANTTGPNVNYRNVVLRRVNVVLTGGALNAGIFLADHSGVDLTMDTVHVDGDGAPNGALFFANVGTDLGCHSLTLRHVRVKPSVRFEGLETCQIIEWTDVAYDNGTPIPHP